MLHIKNLTAGYGKVNVEGFAVGSIQNQGFYEEEDIGFITNDTGQNSAFQIVLDASYDTSKITLKWYVDGVEDTSKQNQTTVSFSRPVGNNVEIYTAKAIDLTGVTNWYGLFTTGGTSLASGSIIKNFYIIIFKSKKWKRL